MAKITSGIVTAFSNTPQAMDDVLTYTQGVEGTKLTLDVMANDLGGNAKTLWALDDKFDGAGASNDLLTQAHKGVWKSAAGAAISITADGKISYDAAFWGDLNYLAAGEKITDSFVYSIRMSDGAISWATAKVVLVGTNDIASVTGITTGSVCEDGTATAGAKLTVVDLDHDQSFAQAQTTVTDHGTFKVLADGTWTFTLNNSSLAVQSLQAGEVVHDTVVFRSLDGSTTRTLDVAITGKNDAASIDGTATGTGTEDDASISGKLAVHDVDHDQAALVAQTGVATDHGSFTVKADGSWSFAVNNAAVQHLAVGASVTDSITVASVDGTAQQTITVTITGTNDAPVATAAIGATTEDASPFASGTLSATDADDGATLTFSLTDPLTAPAGISLDGNGHWSFDSRGEQFQHLAEGQTQDVVVHYTVTDEHGATSNSTLTITVTGTNDAPVATAATDSVAEDASILDGQLVATDVDDGAALTFSVATGTTAPDGLTLHGDGSWSFDASGAAYQHLAVGETEKVTLNYTVTDEHGATSDSTLVITVTGTNDAPEAKEAAAEATEDGDIVTGTLPATDADTSDSLTFSVAADSEAPAGLTLNSDGSWSFNPVNAAYQHLAVGEKQEVTLNYTVTDGHGGSSDSTLVITVSGTNDAPVAEAATGTATEDGAAGTGHVTATDVDTTDKLTFSLTDPDVAPAGLTLNSDGSWSLDASGAAYQHLAEGQTEDVLVHYTVSDGNGGSSESTLTITVTGTNDAPEAAAATGTAVEDGTIATGQLVATDVDTTDTLTFSVTAETNLPAGLTLNADGSWSFNPGNAASQHLAEGVKQDVTLNYTVSDGHGGSSDSTLVITVTGTNDTAIITGVSTGDVTEDGTLTASGQLNVADADDLQSFAAADAGTTDHGSWSVDEAGAWSFTATNSSIQHLAKGATAQDSFVVHSLDGSATQTVTVTLTGVNDDASISGDTTGSVTEDNATPATGKLTVSDVDDGEAQAQVASGAGASALGSYSVDAAGNWSYTADNAKAQHLGASQSATDSFTVTSADGTASETVTVTINGVNDAASISGAITGSVTEDATLVANGKLTVSDADDGEAQATAASGAGANALGSYSVDADGNWSYSADSAKAQHLGANATATDSFVVTSADGSASQTVTVTIHGANDAASISGTASGDVTEDGTQTASGSLSVSDVDDGQAVFQAPASLAGSYGSFSFNATSGAWGYTLDNAAAQSLAAGATATEKLTVLSKDGTASQDILVTVHGTQDVPTFTGTATGSVTEDLGPATASGSVKVADVDAGQSGFSTANGNVAGLYGTWTFSGSGDTKAWSYALDNANATVNALNNGQTLHDTLDLVSTDGTHKALDVLINGHTDLTAVNDYWLMSNGAGTNTTGSFSGAFLVNNDMLPPSGVVSTSYSVTSAYTLNNAGAHIIPNDITMSTVTNASLSTGFTITLSSNATSVFYFDYTVSVVMSDGSTASSVGTVSVARVATQASANTVDLSTELTTAGFTTYQYSWMDGKGGSDSITAPTTLNGGYGRDIFIGGDGNDTLSGGMGDDTLTGNAGNDQFNFGSGFGHDLVMDFSRIATSGQGQSAVAANMDSIHLLSGTFANLTITQSGADTVITSSLWTANDALTLHNVTASNVTSAWFI